MLTSVLVANRGEIAVRIVHTLRRLGVRSVAVYSEADARALHVRLADEALAIGGSAASESYLDQGAILAAAVRAGVAAVHPGYGFLAENPEFAAAVEQAGLTWVGPPPAAMHALGDKARARALAEREGVPILAGYHGADQSAPALSEHAEHIGFPVLIKASAGGGGRGLRVVERGAEFGPHLEAARREAMASFGDDRVVLERYVRRPRHVEVQILGDRHGRIVSLGERECSIQRRHQKLIEETPSPAVAPALRARMAEAALRLARAAGYSNAGTIEFLLDQTGEFAFLEVNARLQVEHPVTEAVSGLDLVELQLRVASGERLPFDRAGVSLRGHAIEARIVAEDVLAGFRPSSGTLSVFRVPRRAGTRVDSWVEDGTQVSPYYDSLLAKVIAHADTRLAAIERLGEVLAGLELGGVAHNVDLLLAVLDEPSFRAGDIDTDFLAQHGVLEGLAGVPPAVLAAASALDALQPPASDDPWCTRSAWRLGRVEQPVAWLRAGRRHAGRLAHDLSEPGCVSVDTDQGQANVRWLGGASVEVDADGHHAHARVTDVAGDVRLVEWQGRRIRLERPAVLTVAGAHGPPAPGARAGELTAPMPARVVNIAVQPGQPVAAHEPLLVLEAMKMEHVVEAPHAGVVGEIWVEMAQQVGAGQRLLSLETVAAG